MFEPLCNDAQELKEIITLDGTEIHVNSLSTILHKRVIVCT